MMTSAVAEAIERENARIAKNGGPAFPILYRVGDMETSEGGLTKREYMATALMAGILANSEHLVAISLMAAEQREGTENLAAKMAKDCADALLAELAK